MRLDDAWTSLRHGGNLLSPPALIQLPEPPPAPWGLHDRLRRAMAGTRDKATRREALGELLDTVLDAACGLQIGWNKGSAVPPSYSVRLLDGSSLKPRRVLTSPDLHALAIFDTDAERLGVGNGKRPVAQVVEYLRRQSISLGLITNGTQWRLIWADTDNQAWVEWESERWLQADQLTDEFVLFRRILSHHALQLRPDGHSPLLLAIRDTRRGQARLSKELGERVRRAVEALLRGRAPVISPAWAEHNASNLYVAASHFVMRLVVVLFAEARELLPTDNPVYHSTYGLRGLLDQLDRLTWERRRSRFTAWPRLLALFRLLHRGSLHPALTLPVYGGELFAPGDSNGTPLQKAVALLESIAEPPDDDVVHRMLVLLTRTTLRLRDGSGWRHVAAPVDFTELTSEYIGILYEGLLDYELHRANEQPVVFLNLGDQPALPLDRLEAMDDRALRGLVEKAKVQKKTAQNDEDSEESEVDADSDDDDQGGGDADDGVAELAVESSGADELELSADDTIAQHRARAMAWARRATLAAGLVKRPKGKAAANDAAWESSLNAIARSLIADLKLPGELYLVRWGGTRKGAGTFYTRPQLTLPTVRRTLQPLMYEDGILTEDGTPALRTPEDILALKVCDPAMGSGSFLVAALRVLTEAVVTSLHQHDRIQHRNGRATVNCVLLPEADRHLPVEGFNERLDAVVRRAVVEHCLYGVDLDPLAVELARVALWVETLDRRLPFTFLDHKLRCGDALLGTWLDRFRDYPLLCFDRQSPDSKYQGVHHAADVWQSELKTLRSRAIAEQVDILQGQITVQGAGSTDEELKAAIDRVRRLYRELRAVPAGRPDERARIWRERIQPDVALQKVRDAFDTWCSLWFWPLDQLDRMPLPSTLAKPGKDAQAVVKGVQARKRFFHWELEFPDVFTEEGSGFDAVVGNPPWEIQKPKSHEFFSNHDPLYRTYGNQEARGVQRSLFLSHSEIELGWLTYLGDFNDRGNFVRHAARPYGDGKAAGHSGGTVALSQRAHSHWLHQHWATRRSKSKGLSDPKHPFMHQGTADLNTYKMFTETAHSILRAGGEFGLVVPGSIYADKGSSALRSLLLRSCNWRWLYSLENRNQLFDIHRSFKFCIIIAQKSGQTTCIKAAFMRSELEDWSNEMGVFSYPTANIPNFSPTYLAIQEVSDLKDIEIRARTLAQALPMGSPTGHWNIEYSREFHITEDSHRFPPIDDWKARGYEPTIYGHYAHANGEKALPVYEGRIVGQFDYQVQNWVSGKGRSSVWAANPWTHRQSHPQYLMAARLYEGSTKRFGTPKIAVMQVTSATNTRTVVACLAPDWPGVDKTPFLRSNSCNAVQGTVSLVAILNSYVIDYFTRSAVAGMTLGWYTLECLPLPPYTTSQALSRASMCLSLIGEVMADYWLQLGSSRPPHWRANWAITTHERLRLRCMLDAMVAVLYGLNREDFAWILKDCDHPAERLGEKAFCRTLDPKGFWRVDKTQPPELRHTVLSMVAFDDLQQAIRDAGGDRDAGLQTFCDQNDGDGWMLPESVCIAALDMTRTVNVDNWDSAATTPQPVRSRMGPRFLDWQLAMTPEEAWADCLHHAEVLSKGLPGEMAPLKTLDSPAAKPQQGKLF